MNGSSVLDAALLLTGDLARTAADPAALPRGLRAFSHRGARHRATTRSSPRARSSSKPPTRPTSTSSTLHRHRRSDTIAPAATDPRVAPAPGARSTAPIVGPRSPLHATPHASRRHQQLDAPTPSIDHDRHSTQHPERRVGTSSTLHRHRRSIEIATRSNAPRVATTLQGRSVLALVGTSSIRGIDRSRTRTDVRWPPPASPTHRTPLAVVSPRLPRAAAARRWLRTKGSRRAAAPHCHPTPDPLEQRPSLAPVATASFVAWGDVERPSADASGGSARAADPFTAQVQWSVGPPSPRSNPRRPRYLGGAPDRHRARPRRRCRRSRASRAARHAACGSPRTPRSSRRRGAAPRAAWAAAAPRPQPRGSGRPLAGPGGRVLSLGPGRPRYRRQCVRPPGPSPLARPPGPALRPGSSPRRRGGPWPAWSRWSPRPAAGRPPPRARCWA